MPSSTSFRMGSFIIGMNSSHISSIVGLRPSNPRFGTISVRQKISPTLQRSSVAAGVALVRLRFGQVISLRRELGLRLLAPGGGRSDTNDTPCSPNLERLATGNENRDAFFVLMDEIPSVRFGRSPPPTAIQLFDRCARQRALFLWRSVAAHPTWGPGHQILPASTQL